jgi:hypothetical protein
MREYHRATKVHSGLILRFRTLTSSVLRAFAPILKDKLLHFQQSAGIDLKIKQLRLPISANSPTPIQRSNSVGCVKQLNLWAWSFYTRLGRPLMRHTPGRPKNKSERNGDMARLTTATIAFYLPTRIGNLVNIKAKIC